MKEENKGLDQINFTYKAHNLSSCFVTLNIFATENVRVETPN